MRSAREELISLLRTTMDTADATTVADAYRAEVLREAGQEFKTLAPLVFNGAEIAVLLGGLATP